MTAGALPDWLFILTIGVITTYSWRLLGVLLVRRLDPQGTSLLLVRSIATALVSALVMKLMIAPPGVLATTQIVNRFLALAVGAAFVFTLKRHQPLAIAAALLTLIALEAIGFHLG
ncbi:AzlD domain-containing protein [Rhodoligotrophos ferricapiens]|uniref:AzlD domain-containing protein n=1 Tax=Rhodoligotrophos ferricapiens TaxID=3069264 RepID=UPI00315DD3AA